MSEYIKSLLILCPLIFTGSLIDAIAGGGGVITLPAYLIAGFPAHLAAGTNKLIASCGALSASYKYIRNGSVVWRVALPSIAGALAGGAIGSRLALLVPDKTLKLIIMIALPMVAVFLALRRNFGQNPVRKEYSPKATVAIAFAIGAVFGCYDGLVGPGTGTFMIIAFTGLLGYDMLTSSACARVSNMASNVAALTVFVLNKSVDFAFFAPLFLCTVSGGWLGARYAIRGGSKSVRKIMFLVLGLIFAKMVYDFIS